MKFYVYIVECADQSLYVGCTNDLAKRLKQHNESRWGAHYTKIRRPVTLKYSETFTKLKDARRRESEIKGWNRQKKLNLIQKRLANISEEIPSILMRGTQREEARPNKR